MLGKTNKAKNNLIAACLGFLVSMTGAHATSETIAGTWQQINSNAGQCPTCEIEVSPTFDGDGSLWVRSNNGWQARVELDPHGYAATGEGNWSHGIDGVYSGKHFYLDLATDGLVLLMKMDTDDPDLSGPIVASFQKSDHHGTDLSSHSYPAVSWGGIVRSGPGMEFDRIASLYEGEQVQIIEKTQHYMNGYPWMRISFQNGHHGYQWGGILCSLDGEREELYQVCNQDNDHAHDTYDDPFAVSVYNQTPREAYRCESGNIVSIGFDNRTNNSSAIVDYLAMTRQLFSVISGSGARYSDGTMDLHTKGDMALLRYNGIVQRCYSN